jgi:hypothetical protein
MNGWMDDYQLMIMVSSADKCSDGNANEFINDIGDDTANAPVMPPVNATKRSADAEADIFWLIDWVRWLIASLFGRFIKQVVCCSSACGPSE